MAAAEAELGADLPVTPLEAHEQPFESIGAMARASDLIVVGLVSSVKPIGTPDKGEDPHASEYFVITIETEEALKGRAPGRITLAWEGFVTDGAGIRTLRVDHNGVAMPDEGERLLLFLIGETRERSNFFGGDVSHRVNTLDGILYVEPDGTVNTTLHGAGRPAHLIDGAPISEVPDILADSP